jgi:AraC-like DNA-binding protein
MLLRTYTPQIPLSLFVDYFWYFEGYNPSHSSESTLPDGSVDVVIDLRQDTIHLTDRQNRSLTFNSSIVSGPHSEFYIIDTSQESTVIGIHFKPGGIRPFLKMPLHELHNVHMPMDFLWGYSSGEIRDELLESDSPENMFRVLERRLFSLAVRPLTKHPAIQFVLSEFQNSPFAGTVGKVMDQIGISHRHFNQIFKEEIGMTPKRLCRIIRFQQVLRMIDNGRMIDWSDTALACGYYDQAHFIKDFRNFSGIKPSEYETIAGRHYNHVAISP